MLLGRGESSVLNHVASEQASDGVGGFPGVFIPPKETSVQARLSFAAAGWLSRRSISEGFWCQTGVLQAVSGAAGTQGGSSQDKRLPVATSSRPIGSRMANKALGVADRSYFIVKRFAWAGHRHR